MQSTSAASAAISIPMTPCSLCSDPKRDKSTIIVVEDVSDLWALQRANVLNASYHVLGGTLSPLDGIGPDDLAIAALVDRVDRGEIREVIIAVNATVEGQTTAHYITDQLEKPGRVNLQTGPWCAGWWRVGLS